MELFKDTPKGVIISREWWRAVNTTLNDEERLLWYDAVMSYSFGGEVPEKLPRSVRVAFSFVRPFIDAERAAYTARCKQNRENAKGGKRVAASGNDSLQVASNNNTNTDKNNNINNNKKPISIERERFFITAYFFAKGVANAVGEMRRFWNYYEALGWRNNKGAEIVSKQAAARMWQPEGGASENEPELRAEYSRAWLNTTCTDIIAFGAVQRFYRSDDELVLFVTNTKALDELLKTSGAPVIKALLSASGCKTLRLQHA